MTNEKAVVAYIEKIEEARRYLNMIKMSLDDHMGIGPDDVDWSHVGSISHVLESLKDIEEFIGR
jgi:hypothetical protein